MSETMIHPETGALLRRRKRMETVAYRGRSRTVEVEGWFPDGDGDGILVGADSKPLDDALAEMKAGWPDPARPGVPMNPEHCIKCGKPTVYYWGNTLAGYGPLPKRGSIDNRPKEKMGCASCGKKWNTLTGKEER